MDEYVNRSLAVGPPPATNNVDAAQLPFQRWYRFKEAFSPSFVEHVLGSLPRRPASCLDPFGGSGTTAVTAQRLGIEATTIEVNPFLADLIESKLATYDLAEVRRGWREVLRSVEAHPAESWPDGFPRSFVEPGVNGRWIFDRPVADRIGAYRRGIERLDDPALARLLRVVLAAVLVENSNVTISGKGRRYRSGLVSDRSARDFDDSIDRRFLVFFTDIARFGTGSRARYTVLRGDARKLIGTTDRADAILFSPPYPNSFDYTDIYNVELWGAGYLTDPRDNRALREATLTSHVQIVRTFERLPYQSDALEETLRGLLGARERLWNPHIPAMVEAYFVDLCAVLVLARDRLAPDGRICLVIGDSRYAGVRVDAARVLCELTSHVGLRVLRSQPVRAMRASPQQGGAFVLNETLMELAIS